MSHNTDNQTIKCRVENCRYYENSNYCSLKDIVVGSDTSNAMTNSETKCMSFEVK